MSFSCCHYSNIDNEIDKFGIVLKSINGSQFHTGVVFEDENGELCVFHLAWHLCLKKDRPKDKYIWADMPLDDISKLNLAAFCSAVDDMNPEGLPYSLCFDGAKFAPSGKFTPKHKSSGFTCATFVLGLLDSYGFSLIDYDSWILRPEDQKWQRQVMQMLEKTPDVSDDYLKDMEQALEKGADRFRPEHVCSALIECTWPAGYFEAVFHGKHITRLAHNHSLDECAEEDPST